MKKLPKFLLFLIAASLVSTNLSGCGGKKKNPVSPVSSSSSASKDGEYSDWNKEVEARAALGKEDYATVESMARKQISSKPNDAGAHFLLGQALLGQKQYRAAKKSLETASSLVPDNLNFSREYCRCLSEMAEDLTAKKEYSEAISLYKTLIEKNYEPNTTESNLSDVYIALSKKMILQGESGDAEMVLIEGANLLRNNADLRLAIAKLYVADERFMEAERLLKKLVNTNPDNSDYITAYASLLKKIGDIEEAAAMANKALSINPNDRIALAIRTELEGDLPTIVVNPLDNMDFSLEAINERLKFFETSNNLPEQKKLLQVCLERYPDQIGAFYKLAVVCEKLGETDVALAAIEKYNSATPNSLEGQFIYAKLLCQKGEWDRTLQLLAAIEELYPDKAAIANERGQAQAKKGDFAMAVETWNSVLKNNPQNADALFYLGQISQESGKFAEASAYFESAIKQQPFNNKFRYFAGINHIQSGNKDKAAELWNGSKSNLNPQDPYAARILRALGEDPELQISSNLITAAPTISVEDANLNVINIDDNQVLPHEISEMPQADYDQALEYARSGNFTEAENLFRQVIATDPNHFNAIMNLGKIYTATGQHNIAAAIFLKALKIDTRNIHALRALANSYSEVGMHSMASQITDQVKINFPDQLQGFPTYATSNLRNDPRAIEPMAKALLSEGLYNEALAVVQGAISQQSDNNSLYMLQGDVYKEMKMFDLAAESYRHVQNADQQSPLPYIKMGDLNLSAGYTKEALVEYRKALKTPFIDPDSMFYISDRYVQMGRPKDAKSLLAQLKTMNLNMEQVKKLDNRLGTDIASETVQLLLEQQKQKLLKEQQKKNSTSAKAN